MSNVVILEDTYINKTLVSHYDFDNYNRVITVYYSNDLKDIIRFPTEDSFLTGLEVLGK
jgi:hypothetical protein